MQRADIMASSGHAPLSITHRSAQSPGVDESTFPLVPPLSSFKARQEDEDSDNEDSFCGEFGSLDQARTRVRASDPQETMLEETDACSSIIDVYLPELVGDLTRDEASSLLHMVVVELSSISERTDREERPEATPRSTKGLDTESKATSISLSVDQVILTAHQQIEKENEEQQWYSHEFMIEGLKAHAVLFDLSHPNSARVMAHELNLYEGTSVIVFVMNKENL
jgi:hypothetical protein